MSSPALLGGDEMLTYNGDGQRVEKQSPTDHRRFIYDYCDLLLETDAAGDVETEYYEKYGETFPGNWLEPL